MSLVFNGDPNNLDICTLADKLAGGQNDNNFPLADKAMYANMGMRILWGDAFIAYGGWVYDDSNRTDLPEATADLVSGQQFYGLPITDMSHLIGVEFKNQGGTWITLVPITVEKIKQNGYAESEFYKTSSTPLFYRPTATGIKLYPPANYSQASSLRIHVSRDITTFTPTSTNTSPGFDPLFHEGVSLYMALRHAQAKGLGVAGGTLRGGYKTGLLSDWFDFEDRFKRHYAERFKQMFPPRLRVVDSTRDFM